MEGADTDPPAGQGAPGHAATRTDDIDDRVEARLDALQRASQERRAELFAIAAALPAATSRRAYLAAMARGIVGAPDKPTVARRVVSKALRAPVDLIRSRRS